MSEIAESQSTDVDEVEGVVADAHAQELLRSFVNRIERLDDEIAGLRDDRKDVMAEAKAMGFDTAAMREVISRRKRDPEALAAMDAIVETYEIALGGVRRGTVWGGELRAQKALPAPKATDRSRRAEEALAALIAADRAEGL